MKKSKERTVLFILCLLLIPFFLAFKPAIFILVNKEFDFQIFLEVLFLIGLVAVLTAAYLKGKKD